MSINGTGKYELWFLILAIYISILCLIVIGVLSVKFKHNEELVGKTIKSPVSIIEITRTSICFAVNGADKIPYDYYEEYKIFKRDEKNDILEWEEMKINSNNQNDTPAVVFTAPDNEVQQITYDLEQKYGNLEQRRI